MADRPNTDRILQQARIAGLNLSGDQAETLASGGEVDLESVGLPNQARAAAGGCQGIKIVDLGNGCGIYVWGWPPKVGVCCEA